MISKKHAGWCESVRLTLNSFLKTPETDLPAKKAVFLNCFAHLIRFHAHNAPSPMTLYDAIAFATEFLYTIVVFSSGPPIIFIRMHPNALQVVWCVDEHGMQNEMFVPYKVVSTKPVEALLQEIQEPGILSIAWMGDILNDTIPTLVSLIDDINDQRKTDGVSCVMLFMACRYWACIADKIGPINFQVTGSKVVVQPGLLPSINVIEQSWFDGDDWSRYLRSELNKMTRRLL